MDFHDVDEDLRSIIRSNGKWDTGYMSGIAYRDIGDVPTNSWSGVASRLIYLS